jgi:exonuclease SbcC
MRILRLTLSNLNSLQGPNAIDFTTPPLANSGLFAITGPTGAGKSTLLDAITLALYGRAARYGNVPNPDAVMSRHTGECSAEVEFSCAAGTFRSVWQLQRARKKPDGKLQQAKRRVIALPAETIIAESIKDADAKILELTGLDYDRFLRSVLLAQGDFAAFLKAGPKERTDLLQQVTGTGIYQEISQAAFRRSADAQQAHAALLRDHASVPVLAPEERARHEGALAAHTQRLSELTGLLQDLTKRLGDAQRWLEIEKGARQLDVAQTDHAHASREAVPALAQLQLHEKAAHFIADLTSLDRLDADHARDGAALRALEASLPELARRLHLAETGAHQAQTALVTEETRVAGLRVLWTEVTELDKLLAAAREALRQLTTQHTGLEKNAATLTTALAHEQSARQTASQAHSTATAWLTAHAPDAPLAGQLPEIQATAARWTASDTATTKAQTDLAQRQKEVSRLQTSVRNLTAKRPPLQGDLQTKAEGVAATKRALDAVSEQRPLPELESLRDHARDRRLALEKLSTDATRLRSVVRDLADGQTKAALTADALVRSTVDLKNRQQRHEDATKLLAAQRTALAFAEKVQSLEQHRTALQADTACPLCGAVHHPYAVPGSQPSAELSGVRSDVTAAETALKNAQDNFTNGDKQHAVLVRDQDRLTAESAKHTAEHATLLVAWNTAATPHNLEDQFENEALLASQLSAAQVEETRRATQVAAGRAAEQALQKAQIAQQTAQTELDRIQHEIATQTALTAQANEQLPALEATLAGHRQTTLTQQAAVVQLVSAFGATGAELASVPALLDTLKNRATDFARNQTVAGQLAADLGVRQSKCDALTQQLAAATTAVTDSRGNVSRAQSDVKAQEAVRLEKFADHAVADAQRDAEATLKRLREAAEKTRGETDHLRQQHTAAMQERNRLNAAVTTRTTERQTLAARFAIAALAAGFADEGAVRSALLSEASAKAHAALRDRLQTQRITLETQAAGLAKQRALLPESAGQDAPNLASLQTEHGARDAERTAMLSSVGEVRALLSGDTEQRARQAAFTAQIEAAHRDYVRWDKLRGLIGSADGSLFARFAQGLTLERLTILANRHLVQLNRRYSIRRAADGEAGDLELEIVDHDQADAARPMRSLSGGESFLVSLALALGLSELASGLTSIESLFIDEGFGSLDADTLEIAMSALENLQAGGKTIGVISHVPAMQERIAAQINVTKETGGCSRVRIMS